MVDHADRGEVALLVARIHGERFESDPEGFVAEAAIILESDWLAQHDRQEREKGRMTRAQAIDVLLAKFGEPPWDISLMAAISALFPLSEPNVVDPGGHDA